MGKLPVGAPEDTVAVRVDELPVTLLGLKPIVTPLGCPEAVRETVPVKPPERVIERAVEALLPLVAVIEVGLADI
jgi:hypothetical protein